MIRGLCLAARATPLFTALWVLAGLAVLSSAAPATAVDWVQLRLGDGTDRRAALAVPDGKGPHPAVVYMHGTLVRERGYQGAVDAGYDIRQFARAFADIGFVGLAPLRETPAGCCNGDEAIAEGQLITEAAAQHLKGLSYVDGGRICLVGFSEGGLISLWAMTGQPEFRAAVIMSAASMGGERARSDRKSARHLGRSRKVEGIRAPLHFTLGSKDKGGIRKGTNRFAEQSDSELTVLPGDHKSFHAVRDDVLSLIKNHCR